MKYFKNIFLLVLLSLLITNIIFAETEPNNTYLQASTLGLNTSDIGALNEQTQTLAADNEDWWKLTLLFDGSLYIETNSSSGLDIDLFIIDSNGSSVIKYAYRTGVKESVYHAALKAGIYFVRAYRATGTGSYTILSRFTATLYTNDSEPNDTYQQAMNLNLNSEATGHIRHYGNLTTDNEDWWKVIIPADGSIRVTTESDSAEIDLYMYDINGTSVIVSAYKAGLREEIVHNNLMPGTYFIRVYGYASHGGYKITSVYTQTAINGVFTNDTEKNDSYSSAINLVTFNGIGTTTNYGHLGFYSGGYTDYEDWWAVTVSTDGKLSVKTESNPTLEVDLYIYDVNGTSVIKSAYAYGVNEQITFDNLASGKYYVRTYRSTGYGSYKITAEYSVPSMGNDSEPNDDAAKAIPIIPDTKMTGHLGYYSNGYTDYDDYYIVNLPTKWDSLYVRTDSDASLELDLYLFNSPTTIIASAYAYGTREIIKYANAPAGTYYIRAYRSSGQGSYAIKITNKYPGSVLSDVREIDLLPTKYNISQNYPNPFNPSTKIRYSLPQASHVKLALYDVLGVQIFTLIDSEQPVGNYEIELNGNNLASGVYFVRMNAGNYSVTKKIMLMK